MGVFQVGVGTRAFCRIFIARISRGRHYRGVSYLVCLIRSTVCLPLSWIPIFGIVQLDLVLIKAMNMLGTLASDNTRVAYFYS